MFNEIQSVFDCLNRDFGSFNQLFTTRNMGPRWARELQAFEYPVGNIGTNKDGDWVIRVALAGFSKDDITVKVRGHSIHIEGERTIDDEIHFQHGIKEMSSFKNDYFVPTTFDLEKIIADLTNGMLTIKVPQKQMIVACEKNERVIPIGMEVSK
jgi:HSP20 family molecular chaperone IbpA